jgi:hypothetical protein
LPCSRFSSATPTSARGRVRHGRLPRTRLVATPCTSVRRVTSASARRVCCAWAPALAPGDRLTGQSDCPVRSATFSMNWWRVFGHAEVSRMGQGVGQPRHTRAVLSAQWWDSRAAYGVGMRVIATFVACARLLHCPPMSQCSPTTSRGSNDVQNSQPVPWMGSIIIGPHSPSLPANLQNLAIPIKLNQTEVHDPRMVRAPAYKLPVNCGNSLQSHHLTIRLVDRSDGSLVNHLTIWTAYDLCSR